MATDESKALADEKVVAFTTTRKSGVPVSSPVWIVALDDGRVGFWTSSQAGKTKRLRNNPAVTLQPCTQRGKVLPGSSATAGTATVVESGPDFDVVQSRIKAKYGFMVAVTRFLNRVGHIGRGSFPYADRVVLVTLD